MGAGFTKSSTGTTLTVPLNPSFCVATPPAPRVRRNSSGPSPLGTSQPQQQPAPSAADTQRSKLGATAGDTQKQKQQPAEKKSHHEFRVASAVSVLEDPEAAAKEAFDELVRQLGGHPSFITMYCTTHHEPEKLAQALSRLARHTPWIGGTQSTGLLSATGWQKKSVGLFGIYDPGGFYSVGHQQLEPGVAGARAVGAKLAKRCFNAVSQGRGDPNGIWIIAALGCEDGLLQGIADVMAYRSMPACAVGGGSTCNDEGSNAGSQFCNGFVLTDSVCICVMHSTANIYGDFDNAFECAAKSGVVTKAHGRLVEEIDNRPAATVYGEWSGLGKLDPGVILSKVTTRPVGRVKTFDDEGKPQFICFAPYAVEENGALLFLGEMTEGDRLWQLKGTRESVMEALNSMVTGWLSSPGELHGVMMNWCLCYVLTFPESFDEIATMLKNKFVEKPFLGANVCGEDGTFSKQRGLYAYGNLMISGLSFIGRRRLTDPLYASKVQPPTGKMFFTIVDMPKLIDLTDPSDTAMNSEIFRVFLNATAAKHNGYLSGNKLQKNSQFVVAFQSPVDAVRFAITINRNTEHLNWTKPFAAKSDRKGVCVTIHGGVALSTFDMFTKKMIYSSQDYDTAVQLHESNTAGHTIISKEALSETESSLSANSEFRVALEDYMKDVSKKTWSEDPNAKVQHVLEIVLKDDMVSLFV